MRATSALSIAHETQDARSCRRRGVMNEGLYASWLGLSGIPREAEAIPLERDLMLARLTRGNYHAAKISTAMAARRDRPCQVRWREGHRRRLDQQPVAQRERRRRVPHLLPLSPPLRAEDDRLAVIEAVKDGTIDVIVSSHDPQDVDTKRLPFADAAEGCHRSRNAARRSAPPLSQWRRAAVAPGRGAFHRAGKTLRPAGRDAFAWCTGGPHPASTSKSPGSCARPTSARARKTPASRARRLQGKVLQTLVAGRTVFSS